MSTIPLDVTKQLAPCGITCGTCDLGNGTAANTAKKTLELINEIGIKDWSTTLHGGSELAWPATEKTLDWMAKYAYCVGCNMGGGPPDCAIRLCSNDNGYTLCNQCDELEDCTKFDWLGDYSKVLKEKLENYKGKSKEQILIEALSESN